MKVVHHPWIPLHSLKIIIASKGTRYWFIHRTKSAYKSYVSVSYGRMHQKLSIVSHYKYSNRYNGICQRALVDKSVYISSQQFLGGGSITQGNAPIWSSWPCVITTASILWLHFFINVVSGIIFWTPSSSWLKQVIHE